MNYEENNKQLEKIEDLQRHPAEKVRSLGRSLFASAHGAIRAIGETASNASETLGNAIESSPIPDATKAFGEAAGSAARTAIESASNTAGQAAEAASSALGTAGNKASEVVQTLKDNSREAVVKRAKKTAFVDGMRQAEFLIAQKNYDMYCALVALSWYAMRCDGNVAAEEKAALEADLNYLRKREAVPAEVWDELTTIAESEIMTFEEVAAYLDRVGVEKLSVLQRGMEDIVLTDNEIAMEEDELMVSFANYMENRINEGGITNEG